jgi:NADH-quinone oxidoreductase subunit K
MTITLQHYLVLSIALFAIGVVGVVTRRNMLIVLMSIELMLSAANLALVTFARYSLVPQGKVVALFILAVSAAGVAVGLGLVVALYRNKPSIMLDEWRSLRG